MALVVPPGTHISSDEHLMKQLLNFQYPVMSVYLRDAKTFDSLGSIPIVVFRVFDWIFANKNHMMFLVILRASY